MNTLDTICSRKSIRTYTGESITEEELNKILKAGNASPVGMAKYDNMHITIIKDKGLLKEIDEAGAKMFGKPDMHPLYEAPMLILISTKKPEPMMENVSYSNAAIIAHNMALEATELNIGTCYIWGAVSALFGSPETMQKLKLPEEFIPCCGITLGKMNDEYRIREISLDKISKNVIE